MTFERLGLNMNIEETKPRISAADCSRNSDPIRPFPADGLHEARAGVIKALAHPTRLWMVEELAAGPRCVCEFVDAVPADFSTVSKHLSVLRNAGIVAIEKRGKQIYYSLKVPCILGFLGCVTEVLKNDAASRNMVLKSV